METIKFETEEHRQHYIRIVIRMCYHKDCMVGYTAKGIVWPAYCTPDCKCRQDTERAARRAVEVVHGH